MKFFIGILVGFYVAMMGVDNFSRMIEEVVMTVKRHVKGEIKPSIPLTIPPSIPQQPAEPIQIKERLIEA